MFLNGYIIYKHLAGVKASYLNSDPLHAALLGAMPLADTKVFDPTFVYVGSAKELEQVPFSCSGITFLVTGSVEEELALLKTNDVLCFGNHVLCRHLIAEVYKLYSRLNQWEERLKQAILNKKSLNQLCCLASEFFQNPLLIHNVDFQLLGIGEYKDYRYPYQLCEPDSDYLVQEVVDMLITDPDYPETFKYHTPQLFYDKWDLCDLYINVFIEGTYVARIVVDSPEGAYLTNSDFYPLYIFSKYVQNHLELYPASVYRYLPNFKGQMADFVNNPDAFQGGLPVQTLQRIKWERYHHYLCMHIVSGQRARSSSSIVFQCGLLENTFNNCIAFSSGDYIVCIMNLDIHGDRDKDMRNRIMQFLRDQLMHAGISDVYTDFQKTPYYYRQAQEAFSYGEAKGDSNWGHIFSELRLEYVLHKGLYFLNAEVLFPYELHQLLEHDREHNGHLVETLRVYIEENGNIQNSLQRLFIHRSTFNYRFMKIREITRDLLMDSPDKWLYLSLILRLL